MTEKQQQLQDNNLSSTILYAMVKLEIHSGVEELSDFEVDRINSFIETYITDEETEEDVAIYMTSLLGKWNKIKK